MQVVVVVVNYYLATLSMLVNCPFSSPRQCKHYGYLCNPEKKSFYLLLILLLLFRCLTILHIHGSVQTSI